MNLVERDVLKILRRHLSSPDILVLHGARQVGKTSVMRILQDELIQAKQPTHFIDLEDMRLLNLLNTGPERLFQHLDESGLLNRGRLYLFVDEIQYLNNPSNLLKIMRDHFAEKIKLVVSGSSSFDIKSKFKNSLAGRTVDSELLPLSFREFLRFKNDPVDLDRPIHSELLVRKLKELFIEFVLYGGYPRVVLEKEIAAKETYLAQVISTYIRKDVRDLTGIKDVDKFNKLLEALAAQSGQLINTSELAGTVGLSRATIDHYLFLLAATYVIRLVRPFSRNTRSELTKMPKAFFLDTGVAQLLWLRSFQKTVLGSMLENTVYCELLKNHSSAEIRYWRTQDGKEIDFILRIGEALVPVEVKSQTRKLNMMALRYFCQHYETSQAYCVSMEKSGAPADFLKYKYPWENFPE